MSLTPESTLRECFNYFDREDNPVQVVPMTISQAPDDTKLAIFIHGDHIVASSIMAELMEKIDELFDLQAQAEAAVNESESRIITG